jgi:hypothetical protein
MAIGRKNGGNPATKDRERYEKQPSIASGEQQAIDAAESDANDPPRPSADFNRTRRSRIQPPAKHAAIMRASIQPCGDVIAFAIVAKSSGAHMLKVYRMRSSAAA